MFKGLWTWFSGNLSIRKKLLLAFGVLVCACILVMGVYTYHRSVEYFEKQADATMQNNLHSLVNEMTYRFERETDTLKYLAFNLNFRKVLEYQADNRVAIAMELNRTVEPVLWYYITSDALIKGFDIYTPAVDSSLGDFLKSSDACEDQEWYQRHLTNFRNLWTYSDGNLYASRTILDTASSSKPLGVFRVSFFTGSFIEPFEKPDYLNNGILVTTQDSVVVYHKKCGNSALDEGLKNGGLSLPAHRRLSATIGPSNWNVTYYVDQVQITHQLNNLLLSTLWVVLLCLVAAVLVVVMISRSLTRRLETLKDYAGVIAAGHLDMEITTSDTDEIGVLTNTLGQMVVKLRVTIHQAYVMQLEKRATELKALQAMINPHFLYNVLSAIKWRAIRKGDDDISNITGLLAKFYRTSLNEGRQLTTVGGELENVRSYLELQQLLLDESFGVAYEIDPAVLPYPMLNFLLQPLLENAVKHGIAHRENGGGKIGISARMEGESIVFNIRNNGPQLNMDTLNDLMNRPGKGYGIYNIRQRIELYYGDGYGVSSSAQGEWVCFTVRIATHCGSIEEAPSPTP